MEGLAWWGRNLDIDSCYDLKDENIDMNPNKKRSFENMDNDEDENDYYSNQIIA